MSRYPSSVRHPALALGLAGAIGLTAMPANAQWRHSDHDDWRHEGWHHEEREHGWRDRYRRAYGWGPGAAVGGALLGLGIGAAIAGSYGPPALYPPPAYYPPPPVYYAPPPPVYYQPY